MFFFTMASVVNVEFFIKTQISLKQGIIPPFYELKSRFPPFEKKTPSQIGLS